MSKPKGGRGQKQTYTTSVMRIPDPVKPQVLGLINSFYKETTPSNTAFKPVTSLLQMSVDEVIELYSLRHPCDIKLGDYKPECWDIDCRLDPQYGWNEEYEQFWQTHQQPKLERFLELADKVNHCIWQIDNSFTLDVPCDWGDRGNIYGAIDRLITYRLISHFDEKVVTALELVQWQIDPSHDCFTHFSSLADFIQAAIETGRRDILKTLGVGDTPPVDRGQYWRAYYTEHLDKVDDNYWRWIGNPEAMSFNPTLTNLLQLPEPEKDVLNLLQALKEGKHPFYEAKSNSRWVGDIFVSDGAAFFNSGKYGDWKPERKDKTIQAFKLWHLKAVKKLVGLGKLKEIYKTCFKADWELVEKVLNSPNYVRLEEEDRQKQVREAYNYYYSQRTSTSTKWATVLGVSPTATKQEVKAAYRNLCKLYHPDVPTGDAAKMTEINNAYTEWEQLYQVA